MAPSSHADCAPSAPGQANCTSLTLAEWLFRTADRIDPARVLGPRRCFGRGTSAPDSKIIRRLLQLRQNASVFAQGCADFSSDSSDRNHSFTPDPRRPSPSLRPGLSFRYTQVVAGNHPADLALPNGPTAGRLFNSRHYFSMD